MKHSRKAQVSQSTVASLVIGLVVAAAVSVLASSYITGVGVNYGVSVNESQYSFFQVAQNITNVTSQMTNQFINEDGTQNEDIDIISIMITNAYGTIKLFFKIPALFQSLITGAITGLGIPSGVSNIIYWASISIITIIILFAAFEAVMKVRS